MGLSLIRTVKGGSPMMLRRTALFVVMVVAGLSLGHQAKAIPISALGAMGGAPVEEWSGTFPSWALNVSFGNPLLIFPFSIPTGNYGTSNDLDAIYTGAGAVALQVSGSSPLQGIEIDPNRVAYQDLGTFGSVHFSRSTFNFADTTADLVVHDGLGNQAIFTMTLNQLVVEDAWDIQRQLGSSVASIVADMQLIYNDIPAGDLAFADEWATLGGSIVWTLQVTGLRGSPGPGLEGTLTGRIMGGAAIDQALGASASFSAAPIPEPASLALVGAGLLSLAGLRRRVRKA